MRSTSWLGVVAAMLSAGGLSEHPAHATSMVPLTTDQLVDASDAVVRGIVTEVWTETDSNGQVWTHAQVEVSRVLKGDDTLDALVIEQPGGQWAHRYTSVAGAARFSVGEDAYFFVELTPSGRTVTVGMFQGKFNVTMDPYTRQNIVQRFTVGPTVAFDHRFIPLPAEDDRVSVSVFEDTVLDRVETGWDGVPIPGVSTDKLYRINTLRSGVE